jgi:serine/threonine protein kinase
MPGQSGDILPIGSGYRLIERIGKGTFGEVWKAMAPGEFPAAIKIIHRTVDSDEAQRESRSLDVIRKLQRDHNDCMVQVTAAWHFEDRLIIAMELASGTLRDRLKQCQEQGHVGIPATELIGYMDASARALDFMHSRDVLHRDIKPDNLLICGNRVKVGDFGLVREQNALATMHRPVGTPPYMGPEVWACKAVPASDQYALACTYIELRCGMRPFMQMTTEELQRAHRDGEPDLSLLHENEQVILARALAKDPRSRFRTCQDFVRELRSAVEQTSMSSEPFVIEVVEPEDAQRPSPDEVGTIRPPGAVRTPSSLPHARTRTMPPPSPPWTGKEKPSSNLMRAIVYTLVVLGCVSVLAILLYFIIPPGPPRSINLSVADEVHYLRPGSPCTIKLGIERTRSDPVELTVRDLADLDEVAPVTVPADTDTAEITLNLSRPAPPGLRTITVTASARGLVAKEQRIEIHVLPRHLDPAPNAELDAEGAPYCSRLVRVLGGQKVYFLLIRPAEPGAPPFYVMENKVTNGLFRAYVDNHPKPPPGPAWQKGALAAGADVGSGNPRLPVFRVTRAEAAAFARWMDGKLPTPEQLKQAERRKGTGEGRPVIPPGAGTARGGGE